jgi:hypothetical protein
MLRVTRQLSMGSRVRGNDDPGLNGGSAYTLDRRSAGSLPCTAAHRRWRIRLIACSWAIASASSAWALA